MSKESKALIKKFKKFLSYEEKSLEVFDESKILKMHKEAVVKIRCIMDEWEINFATLFAVPDKTYKDLSLTHKKHGFRKGEKWEKVYKEELKDYKKLKTLGSPKSHIKNCLKLEMELLDKNKISKRVGKEIKSKGYPEEYKKMKKELKTYKKVGSIKDYVKPKLPMTEIMALSKEMALESKSTLKENIQKAIDQDFIDYDNLVKNIDKK